MKKIYALFLICGMTLGFSACGGEPGEPVEQPPQESGTELPEAMATMSAPIHALAETMLNTGMDYRPDDPEFFWNSLHFFLETYGNRHEEVGLSDEGVMRVPRKTMQEHAIALFSSYNDLSELPESLSSRIAYESSWDAYLIYSEEYTPYTLALAELSEENGTYRLEAALSGIDGETVGVWEVELVKNTYADGIQNPLYPYSIASMRSLAAQKDQAVFNGLTDPHTAEVTLSDGTVAAFQFDTDSEVSKALQNLDIGEGFTIEYLTDEKNGTAKIVSAE